MKLLITGAAGFIGKNLTVRLKAQTEYEVVSVTRETQERQLAEEISASDVIVHLAGENRPPNVEDFAVGNTELTRLVCSLAATAGTPPPIVYASSIRATESTPYGKSKLAAEEHLKAYAAHTSARVTIFRLPNVFGKWSRPNYNSAVATFCHNVVRDLPISVHDPAAPLQLAYVDDVVDAILDAIAAKTTGVSAGEVSPVYSTTVGELASTILNFRTAREKLFVPETGAGLVRALHATYLSFLPKEDFSYHIASHSDPRGAFAELLKTRSSGQMSFFTIRPGQVRGGHYHHSKTEKFLVVKGAARFNFRHVLTGEHHSIDVTDDHLQVIETVPGWAHNVANTGPNEVICFLWANEIFDSSKPDTYSHAV